MITVKELQQHIENIWFSHVRPILEYRLDTTQHELDCIVALDSNLNGEIKWQVKETRSPQEPKLKTWVPKEESPAVQPELRSSAPSNDQTLPEKEQKPRTTRTSDISHPKKQFIILQPDGETVVDGEYVSNYELAQSILERLREGLDVIIPPGFTLHVIEN